MDDSKNTYTRYKNKRPDGVCFEKSSDKYLIKKKHTVSNLLLYFKLSPLWCENCSVETTQSINELQDIDYVLPGQILIIPQKCANFSWNDKYNYGKLAEYNDEDIQNILNKRAQHKPEPPLVEKQQPPVTSTATPTRVKVTQVAYNKLGAEPFGLYSELNGKSATIKAKLVTNFGKGLRIFYQRNLDFRKELFTSFSFYQTEITSDLNLSTINNRNQTPLSADFGIIYHLSPDWSFSAVLGLQDNLIFSSGSSNTITVQKVLNTNLLFSPEYSFYRDRKWNISVNAGLGLLLPMAASSSEAKFGSQYDTELKATYKLDFGRVYGGVDYLARLQNNANFDFNEYGLIYRTGIYYLF